MDYDYVIDVVAGSKASIAGYSAVHAYMTAVWAYCMSGERGELSWGAGKEGKWRGEKERVDRK